MLVPDNMDNRPWIGLSLGLALVATACGVTEPDTDQVCEAGKCDGLPFTDQLKGRQDPIGVFLQSLVDAKVIDASGVYHADRAGEVAPAQDPLFYAKLLSGVARVQNCADSSLLTFALSDDLITGDVGNTFPRVVAAPCGDSDAVGNAFVATIGPADDGDVDFENLEMFAWDATAQKYVFYATTPKAGGNLKFEVEPVRCGGCHTTAHDVDPIAMPRIPIMNELTKPWSHWNAGTGGVSDSFTVPTSLEGKPNWERFGGSKVTAASRFEKIIRDASALRVAPARSKNLFRPAKLEEAMGLLRPLFCDEQVNYVSELNTGEISVDALVSGGIKGVFRSVSATWPYSWYNNDNIQLGSTTEDQRLFVMPVRGMAEITYEAQLQAALSPAHVLALRALDYKHAAFSKFRCDLWRNAWTAFQSKAPALTSRNRDAVKVLFDEIMKQGGMSTRDLASGAFIALDDATAAKAKALRDAIAAGNVSADCATTGFCQIDADGFGKLLEAYVMAIKENRAELQAERDRRVCAVNESVKGAGTHTVDESGDARISNFPSFMKIFTGQATGVSTIPESCP